MVGFAESPRSGVAAGRAKQGATVYPTIPGVTVSSTAAIARAANVIFYEPMITDTPIVLNEVWFEVTTVAAASSIGRVAVYSADTDWQPNGLVIDTGTVAEPLIDTLGIKKVTGMSQLLPPGRYLKAWRVNGSVSVRMLRGSLRNTALSDTLGASVFIQEWRKSQAYGAFAGPGTAWDVASVGSTLHEHAVVCIVNPA